MRYAILVEGIEPAPQGSKVLGKYGNLRESCKRVKPWREAVRKEALASCSSMLQGPVRVAVEFRFRRPLADYTSGGELKQGAPRYYVKRKNDIDKLCRSTLDALSQAAFEDDCQVVDLHAIRRYCRPLERPGAFVIIESVTPCGG